ncbi:hypothetical protein LZG74_19900 [Dyadobacter sp. CY327]|uniref:hypothetical protein n=1 Tax=Dyadobacter sp. CY327 TaxID=2907301 RepID=UPI001F4504D3|nr:hypothetical protein [Dyadobacter sp. CY327]MCE7072589.1 hypothetical protein [Dyadobacter sp. CY327]
MKNTILIMVLIMFGVLLIGCKDETADEIPQEGTPTPVGMPIGDAIEQRIGPSGGKIVVNGVMTLEIPSGAVAQERLIRIQPVENKCFSAAGLGYTLMPRDLKFKKPISIRWNYTDKDIAGSSPDALGVAFQQSDNSWKGYHKIILDKSSHMASFVLEKAESFAFYEQFYLKPQTATLSSSETVRLDVFYQKGRQDPTEDDMLEALTPHVLLKNHEVKNWLVNGHNLVDRFDQVLGGMTIIKDAASATYTAPALSPQNDTITVSTEVILKTKAKLILISTFVIRSENEFKLNGYNVKNARINSAVVVDNELLQIGLFEGRSDQQKQNIVNLSVLHFSGVGTYEVDQTINFKVSCKDHLGKPWSERYYTSDGRQVYGPLKVVISEYDKTRKLVAGSMAGTVYYYDNNENKLETGSVSARFKTASPY